MKCIKSSIAILLFVTDRKMDVKTKSIMGQVGAIKKETAETTVTKEPIVIHGITVQEHENVSTDWQSPEWGTLQKTKGQSVSEYKDKGNTLIVFKKYHMYETPVQVFLEDLAEELSFGSKFLVKILGAHIINTTQGVIQMEHMPFSLVDISQKMRTIKTPADIKWSDQVEWMRSIAECVKSLHEESKVGHQQLVPNHILFDATFKNPKLVSVGFEKTVQARRDVVPTIVTQVTHTQYMAPEYLDDTLYDLKSCNIYSLGILFCEILNRGVPFFEPNKSCFEIIKAVVIHKKIPSMPKDLRHDHRKMIEEMLDRDPARRPTISAVYKCLVLCSETLATISSPLASSATL